jgi:glyoxylase-like metal-dependent hydrolase (beta-lactamase superfamily II)
MHRRDFLRIAVPAAGAIAAAPHWLGVAHAGRNPDLVVTPLGEKLQLISGGGGNVVVFNSPEGVLMVDGGSPERSADVLKTVKKLTGNSKVHTLFNTHWHWDQTGSNRKLGSAGTRIISHENTKLWLTTDVDVKWQNRVYQPLPKQALPTKTIYTKESLDFGGEKIEFGYLPQAHTDGDIYVYFRNANVLVCGDVASAGAYPVIDYCTNGWLGGLQIATKTLFDLSNDNTKVVPGLGAVMSRADLSAENEMLGTMKTRLAKLLAKGMSAQDMINAAPTGEYDAKWGDPKLFIANSWPGLVARSRELGVAIV